jgi:hypothetical protein
MERRKDILAVSLLLLVIIIRFSPFVFMGYPLNTDSWKNYYPWFVDYKSEDIKTVNYDSNLEYGTWFPIVKDEISHGRFPLWNPYSGCGMPMYVDHLIPVFHIPFAVALLFPGDLINSAYAFFMAIIGTLFFYWFLRNWRFSVFVSLFGGLVFFLSGWQMYLYPPEVASLIWIPAILLFYDRFLESEKMSDAAWCAFFIGQLLIGGYPAYIAHFFYVVAIYMLWRKFHSDFKFTISTKRWLAGILVMAVFGVLISAVQNYPTWQFMKLTNRDISSESKVFKSTDSAPEKVEEIQSEGGEADNSFKAKIHNYFMGKLTILFPSFQMNPDISRNFVGPVVLMLSLIGLIAASRKYLVIKIMFLIFGVFFLIPPVFKLLAVVIPGWSISALLPREVFYFLMFFLAVVGLDKVISCHQRNQLVGGLSQFFPSMAILAVLFFYDHSSMYFSELFMISMFANFITLLFVYWLINNRTSEIPVTERQAECALLFFIISGLLSHFYLFPYFNSKSYMPTTEAISVIKQICTDGRIVRYGSEEPRLSFKEHLTYILPPNIPSRFGIMDSLGYDNMMLANMEEFLNTYAPGSVIRGRGSLHVPSKESLQPDSDFIRMTGTRYIMEKTSEKDPYNPRYPFKGVSGIKIYDLGAGNEHPYLKCWDNDVNLNVLEFERKTMSTLDASFEVDKDCTIVIADTYHPNWRATLDGSEVEIKPANIAFRAIIVPKGKHDLHMWFDGRDIKAGGVVSAVSLVMLVLIGVCGRKRNSVEK